MPLYVFSCGAGHECVQVRKLADKRPATCRCGRQACFDFAATVRPTIASEHRDTSLGPGERASFGVQTGRCFRTARELDSWARSNDKEIIDVRNGRPFEKMWRERQKQRDVELTRRCERIWQETVTQ